jgi:hypothetical protein
LVNVLADRHHAGLLYSLQLLFEDRLGFNLYVPVGHDWWDEEIWRFGNVFGDDRLAQQYLNPNPPWERRKNMNGLWWCTDVEFPNRSIWGIELEDARDMDWEFTIASVQENQHGFDRFAKEVGAKSVYQVGNRGQQVDWDLDPLVICSAEAPIYGRGVLYHQEYSKDETFAFVDPAKSDSFQVRSFVNCFDSIHPEFERYQKFQGRLKEHQFFTHGHDGADGLVQPTEAVAANMACAGWGYHDKPQGDGFGHIIHYWASIGRPLIGSAAYYQGLFADHLWVDGVTCVDLSKHSLDAAARQVDLVSGIPEMHAEMCVAIRQRLDDLIDFDKEEAEIRSLLGL